MGCETLEDKHVSVLCTKRFAQQAPETNAKRRRRKRRNQRMQPNENAEGNPKKTAAGRERRMEPTPEQPQGRLPAQREEGEKRRGHGRGITASTRPTERDYIRGACQAQVRRGLAPNSQESVEKVERMVAMGPKERGKPNETQSTRNDHSQEIQEKR